MTEEKAETAKTCHMCLQYSNYCDKCGLGRCSWHNCQKSPGCAQDCESYNPMGQPCELRDENAEIFPLVKNLYDFMVKGVIPNGFVGLKSPKLTARKAFSIIYLLQEHLYILPDCFERCDVCDALFDSEREGYMLDDQYILENGKVLPKKYWGHFCDGCVPDVEFRLA